MKAKTEGLTIKKMGHRLGMEPDSSLCLAVTCREETVTVRMPCFGFAINYSSLIYAIGMLLSISFPQPFLYTGD